MTEHAVISGSLSELKMVKTRSVLQIVIEVPLEMAPKVTATLGWPVPGNETPVAIARLNTFKEPKAPKGSLAQQAGILCGDVRFAKFLEETHPHIEAVDTAEAVRTICGVLSRAEFDSDPAAGQRWRCLKGQFEGWKTL